MRITRPLASSLTLAALAACSSTTPSRRDTAGSIAVRSVDLDANVELDARAALATGADPQRIADAAPFGDERESLRNASPPALGDPLAVVSTPVPDLPPAQVRMLGSRLLPTCDARSSLRFFHEYQCEELAVRAVRSTAAASSRANLAADGSACTFSAPVASPQIIELELDRASVVHGLLVVPQMTVEPAAIEGVIEAVDDRGRAQPLNALRGGWQSNVAYGYVIDGGRAASRIRVRITDSRGLVGFRELRPFRCDRQPSAFLQDPPPPPQNPADFVVLDGRGGCRSDRDCMPDVCCHALRCVDAAHAPRCDTGCPASEAPFDQRPLAGCFCNQGRCASRVHHRWIDRRGAQ